MPKPTKRQKEQLLRAQARGWRVRRAVKRPVSEKGRGVVVYEATRRCDDTTDKN